ncbi:response regulator [Saccharibacillus sp. CPCC 101409]|uniref:response regulator n=1 Tax=Saccharibacillus sp. CPCC 101409 TaxID=3058041 RepID=UPI0026737082|nr:response regulator [Saccharibacillus sp. CPCC 101409]MDO3412661.1 response regulator [Saccharibacillus sp. CPCC 101409]
MEWNPERERFKLCVIDDIKSVVEMVSRKPPWQEFGIEIAGTALDGEAGLQMIRETRPDIVLTDIRMPRMDGLQMTRAILEVLPDCKIIILSAYSEFSYAQEAIRLGALDFVKKPFSLDEIVQAVLKAGELCRQERRETARLAAMESKIKESLPILRQEYLIFLLHHRTTESDARSRWAYLDIPLDQRDFFVFVAEIDHFAEKLSGQSVQEVELLRFSLYNILEETISAWTRGVIIREATDRYVCIVNGSDPDTAALITEACCTNVSRFSRHTLSIGVGLGAAAIQELGAAYRQAISALGYHFYTGGNGVYTYSNIENKPLALHSYSAAAEQELLFALRSGNFAKSLQMLDQLFAEMLDSRLLPEPHYVESIGYELGCRICRVLLEQFPYGQVEPLERRIAVMKNRVHPSLQDIRELLSGLCREACALVTEARSLESTRIIHQAVSYIRSHLDTGLSLEQVAKQINLSQGYFSNLFKKVQGVSFQHYVMHEKMEKAKSMLIGGRQVQEIAQDLGYEHRRYFSEVFKKYTGMTPSEFKLHYLGKE